MATWSEKRKLIYATGFVVVIFVLVGIPLFVFIYKAPTCFDGKQNSNETGIDCGGKCVKLCQNQFLAPTVAWTRLEKVTSGTYNVATYIINQNTEGEAKDVPFSVTLYDSEGVLISVTKGTVTLPPHRNTLAFSSLIKVDKSIPVKALFEFTSPPNWYKKTDPLSFVSVIDKKYIEGKDGSSLMVSLKNEGLAPLNSVAVFAVLYNEAGNTIGFSKTVVDEILPKATVIAPFTWNTDRKGEVVSIEVLYVAE